MRENRGQKRKRDEQNQQHGHHFYAALKGSEGYSQPNLHGFFQPNKDTPTEQHKQQHAHYWSLKDGL